ncbi:hypothetical protein HPB47_008569 [Ixodes persulcatus]|uniref:Uncharacterized protein n=1 Tax=Ixodes persulcatus TaxID=34615 RepID=A0AC60P4H4_IXOPE|nr:hypothetical protein HPB47_008569 [Ixodes persulcatus]
MRGTYYGSAFGSRGGNLSNETTPTSVRGPGNRNTHTKRRRGTDARDARFRLSTTGQEATAPRDRIHRRKALNQAPLHQRSPAFARDDPEESRADDPALLQSAPVVYT